MANSRIHLLAKAIDMDLKLLKIIILLKQPKYDVLPPSYLRRSILCTKYTSIHGSFEP